MPVGQAPPSFSFGLTGSGRPGVLVAGASPTRTFTRIVVPMSRRGLSAVWLIMFILMCGDDREDADAFGGEIVVIPGR